MDTAAVQEQLVDDVSVLGMEILRRIDALAAEVAEHGIAESPEELDRVHRMGMTFAEHVSGMIEAFAHHTIEGLGGRFDDATLDYGYRLQAVEQYVRGFVEGGGVVWALVRDLEDGPWDRASITRSLRQRLLFVHERLETVVLEWSGELQARQGPGTVSQTPQTRSPLNDADTLIEEPNDPPEFPDQFLAPEVGLDSDYSFAEEDDGDLVLPPVAAPEGPPVVGPEPVVPEIEGFDDLDDLPSLTNLPPPRPPPRRPPPGRAVAGPPDEPLQSFGDDEEGTLEAFAEEDEDVLEAFAEEDEDVLEAFAEEDEDVLEAFAEEDEGTLEAFAEEDEGALEAFAEEDEGVLEAFAEEDVETVDAINQRGAAMDVEPIDPALLERTPEDALRSLDEIQAFEALDDDDDVLEIDDDETQEDAVLALGGDLDDDPLLELGEEPAIELGEDAVLELGEDSEEEPLLAIGEEPDELGEDAVLELGEDSEEEPLLAVGEEPDELGEDAVLELGEEPAFAIGEEPAFAIGEEPAFAIGEEPAIELGGDPGPEALALGQDPEASPVPPPDEAVPSPDAHTLDEPDTEPFAFDDGPDAEGLLDLDTGSFGALDTGSFPIPGTEDAEPPELAFEEPLPPPGDDELERLDTGAIEPLDDEDDFERLDTGAIEPLDEPMPLDVEVPLPDPDEDEAFAPSVPDEPALGAEPAATPGVPEGFQAHGLPDDEPISSLPEPGLDPDTAIGSTLRDSGRRRRFGSSPSFVDPAAISIPGELGDGLLSQDEGAPPAAFGSLGSLDVPVPDEPAPDAFEEPVPDAFEEPVPDAFEEPAPDAFEEPAPDAFEEPAPDAFEEPAPDAFEEPVPDAFEALSESPHPEGIGPEEVEAEELPILGELPHPDHIPPMPTLQQRFDAVMALAAQWDVQLKNLPEELAEDWITVLEDRVGQLVEKRQERAAEDAERQERLAELMALAEQLRVRVNKVPNRPSQSWLEKMARKLSEVQSRRQASFAAGESDLPTGRQGRKPGADEIRTRVAAMTERAERVGAELGHVPSHPSLAWLQRTEAKLEAFLTDRRARRKAEREANKRARAEKVDWVKRHSAAHGIDIGRIPPFPTDEWLEAAVVRITTTLRSRGEAVPPIGQAARPHDPGTGVPMLVFAEGTVQEERWPIRGEMVIGRAPECDVQIVFDAGVSRTHCRVIDRGDGRFVLEDLGSTKGTRLDGEPIRGEADLTPECTLRVGQTELRFGLRPLA